MPTSKDQFYPDFGTTRDITTIFKRKCEEPWISWTDVTDIVCDMWFRDFEVKYKWLLEDNDIIIKIFKTKGSSALSNNIFKVRVKRMRVHGFIQMLGHSYGLNGVILPGKQYP